MRSRDRLMSLEEIFRHKVFKMLLSKDKIRVNLCSHDAYGIDTVRNPFWSVSWNLNKNEQIVKEYKRLEFKTGDTIGIDIGPDEKPTVYRL